VITSGQPSALPSPSPALQNLLEGLLVVLEPLQPLAFLLGLQPLEVLLQQPKVQKMLLSKLVSTMYLEQYHRAASDSPKRESWLCAQHQLGVLCKPKPEALKLMERVGFSAASPSANPRLERSSLSCSPPMEGAVASVKLSFPPENH
jgi:hypothetical protein